MTRFHSRSTPAPGSGPGSAPGSTPGSSPGTPRAEPTAHPDLAERFQAVRRFTQTLCEPLETEDYVIQTMEDVSPAKWHLAHTSWFFERFLLREFVPGYKPFHEKYDYLFNSYYNAVGPQHCRPNRGLISRPTVAEVYAYRQHVDEHMLALIDRAQAGHVESGEAGDAMHRVVLGLNHEQQHQELMVTDLKHVFSTNPLLPAYRENDGLGRSHPSPRGAGWIPIQPGVAEFGRDIQEPGFAYDNESPRHRQHLAGGRLADRPVTNGEFMAFIADGGYQRHELWLALGWATINQQQWTHPIYWYREDGAASGGKTSGGGGGGWMHYTLGGAVPVDPAEPVCHLSYFEAEAFARWAGGRLPTEFEWEALGREQPIAGNFADDLRLHPMPITEAASGESTLRRAFGDVWEWTQSSYGPYPGYTAPPGALGEYNGKFMCNQYVLRGGSCATSKSHTRATYRNFFDPAARWQFTGLRLAQDL